MTSPTCACVAAHSTAILTVCSAHALSALQPQWRLTALELCQ
jgi:hypothetical protein